MLDDLLHFLDRLLTSDAAEYAIAALAIAVWLVVSKVVSIVRHVRGTSPADRIDEPRPRPRIPLY